MRLLKALVIVVFLLMISLASLAEEVPSLGVDFTPGKPTVRASYISDTEYKDPTLHVVIETGRKDNCDYWLARVKIGHPSQLRTAAAGGFEIDVAVACAAHGDDLYVVGIQRPEGFGVDHIVDEGADGVAAVGEMGGFGHQAAFEVADFIAVVGTVEAFTVVGFRVEECNFLFHDGSFLPAASEDTIILDVLPRIYAEKESAEALSFSAQRICKEWVGSFTPC